MTSYLEDMLFSEDNFLIDDNKKSQMSFTFEDIEDAVCSALNITPDKYKGRHQKNGKLKRGFAAIIRQIIYTLAYYYTPMTYEEISMKFLQDRTTSFHAIKVMRNDVQNRTKYGNLLLKCERVLEGRRYYADKIEVKVFLEEKFKTLRAKNNFRGAKAYNKALEDVLKLFR
jgi:hypothetical protein